MIFGVEFFVLVDGVEDVEIWLGVVVVVVGLLLVVVVGCEVEV